jgi:hypothetical protein
MGSVARYKNGKQGIEKIHIQQANPTQPNTISIAMKSLALFMSAASLLAATVTAAPLEKRAAMCGQWDSAVDGSYTM